MKRILTTLCALAFVMAGSIPALAAEADADTGQSASYYPISVEEYTYGSLDEPRVEKVYQLSLSDDPSGIPTEDFVRNGRLYYLLDMTRKNEVGVDTKPHIETISQASDTNDMETILQQLNAELEVTTEDGYTGILHLDHTIGTPSPAISIWGSGRRPSRRRSGWRHRGCGRLPGRPRCAPCPSLGTRTCGNSYWSRNPSGASGRRPALTTEL